MLKTDQAGEPDLPAADQDLIRQGLDQAIPGKKRSAQVALKGSREHEASFTCRT
jgi:hypothetical protein